MLVDAFSDAQRPKIKLICNPSNLEGQGHWMTFALRGVLVLDEHQVPKEELVK